MLPPILRYSSSILLLLLFSVAVYSQKKSEKAAPVDTVKNRYLPTGVRFGIDAISIIKSRVTKNWTGWEFNGDVDFDRYYLAVEYGHWGRNELLTHLVPGVIHNANGQSTPALIRTASGNYSNSGSYYRIGSDVNFMLKDPEKNMFFLGFRYGTSHFGEKLNYSYSDSLPGIGGAVPHSVSTSNSGLTAHWIELTTGLRVKIWGPFWMGYTARLKLAPSVKGDSQFNTYDIPGYGLKEKSNYWGINYQLLWRIPIRRIK